ncbi:hypothetical protein ACROYT_G003802 [Oculina patagonica]
MKILFSLWLLWVIFSSRKVKGQSDCLRTNRQPSRMCVARCDPSTGCSGPGEECLCDGDCGNSCVKKDLSCGRPPGVRNAKPQYPSTNFGDTVTYICNKGYTLSGASQRTCRANGKWDGVGPNCLRMCSLPTIPFSTYIAEPVNFNRTYMTGERIKLACKKGFKQLPGGNPVRICISGLWTRFPFKCEGTHACKRTIRAPRTKCTQECSPQSGCGSSNYQCLCDGSCGFSCVEKGMSCGNPPPIQNGKLNFTGTNYNSTAHYTCDEGYDLNTEPVKRCTAKKRWDGLTPRCLRDCPEPTIPRNAYISNPSKKYPSGYKVTFKCNEGYNQEGMATQMCFLGKWTVLPFKCTEGGCGDPGTPENGRKLGVTYSVNSVVYFNCDLGYELVGSPDRKCQLNGTWTGIQPVCKVVNCGFPPRPKNGSFIGNGTTFQNSLRFQCDDGFELEGSETRMCTSDKNWSGKEVTCKAVDCGKLSAPMNGSLSGEETTYPNHVQINCDEGFNLLGSHRRTCQANSKWDGNKTSCEAVDCGALTPPNNGSSFGTVTTFPNTMKFSCDAGFDLVGSPSRTCMANKTWSGEIPVCKAVDCGELPPPMNGSVLGKETTYPNEVEINCDEGFILRGSHRRRCKADRTWSGDITMCEAINCGKPELPDHGSVSGFSTRYPHPITFTCDIGYEIQGSVVRRCQANGTWSGNKTRCKPVDCGPLQAPNNGTKSGNKTTYQNEVIFHCDDGFDVMGSSSRVCQANKQWSGDETFCKVKDCGQLAFPTNGSSTGGKTTYPNEITFECDDGFNVVGSRIRKCQSTGIWSGNETFCSAKDCGSIGTLLNGTIHGSETTYPNKVTFTCDDGFNLIGSSVRECTSHGIWNGVETSCEAKDCGPIPTPLNGTTHGNQTTYPNKVMFTCDDGFHLRGSNVRECQSDGVWGGIETRCEAKDCGFLQVPINGSVLGPYLTTFPNSLTFTCGPGFTLKGSRVRHCEANAVWSGNRTICQAKDCGPLDVPSNGTMFGNQTTYPNEVFFRCDEGFVLRGSQVRSCTSEGTWSGTLAFCEAKDCGPLVVPNNGSVTGKKTTFPNEIQFSCDDGFNMHGSRIRKCLSTGIWSGNQTSCTAVDCGHIPTPQNGSIFGEDTTYPNSMEFSCDEGFIISGSTVRRCLPNGTWSGQQTLCKAKDCGILKIPLNGSIVGPKLTTFPNSLTFTCDKGFELKGSRVKHCEANALWSGNETYCQAKDCGSLETPSNGSLFGNLTTYPHKVSFGCHDGFILKGSMIRWCTSEGTWSGTSAFCEAKDCGSLAVPTNGSFTGQKTTYPNHMTFSCDDGFTMTGSRIRHCLSTGIWSGNQTACTAKDCGTLSVPMNGSSSGHKTTFPNTISFSCDVGFVMIGSQKRKCLSNGQWSGNETSCTAVDCGSLLMPMNASSYGEFTSYPNKVYFQCDEGFVLKGSPVRVCLANGSWSGNHTSCKAVDCGELPAPLNGSVHGSSTTFPNTLEFSCDEGFILDGSPSRKCQANTTWGGKAAFCRARDCGKLPSPVNGTVIGNQTTYPNKLTFHCDEGFDLIGSSVRQCEADGNWNRQQPKCNAVDCGQLPLLLNGSHFGRLTTYPNKVLSYCDEGFLLRGSSERSCQANRTWSGTQTKCEAIDCGALAVPLNGSVQGSSTTFPNVLTLTCDDGFILDGSASRTCLANGTWSGNTTLCRAKDCGHLPPPKNGSIIGDQTTYPNELSFFCDVGFNLLGSPVRRCEADGIWSEEQPNCTAVDCGPLPLLLNGSYVGNMTTYPNKVLSYCDEGFLLRGSSERFCQANRTWSGTQTKCEAVDCGGLSAPLNGSLQGSSTTFPHLITFSCDDGFILDGSASRTCQANGTWSGNTRLCRAKDCGNLPPPKNGSVIGNQTTYPNKLSFSCNEGFNLLGPPVRRCEADGIWSGEQPTCKAVDCGPLPSLLNGSYVGNLTTYTNKIVYSCDEGFLLRGSSERFCQANRTWSGTQTKCEAVDCGELDNPINGSRHGSKTSFPNLLQFNCDEGFILHGSNERQCLANGSWSGNQTFCEAIDCGPLPDPMNGSSIGDLTVFPNIIRFSCEPGFFLTGSSWRECQANGTWSGNETTCNPVDCGKVQVPRNGSLLGNYTTFPNKLHFLCDEGFILRGLSVRSCMVNGTWSGHETTCEAKNCGPLMSPKNGSMFGGQTTFPNEVTFSCDEGFIMRGPEKRKCQADGTWSTNVTSCEAVDCGRLSVPLNGSSYGDLTVFPESIRFSCDIGFIMSGSRVRNCQSNGSWSGTDTICNAVDCGRPSTPVNGTVFGEQTTFPNVLQFSCDEGFTQHGATERRCQPNGTWSGNETSCQANDCGSLTVPRNGSSIGNETTYPNKMTFSCDEGFILIGSVIRQCQANKTWSGLETSCKAIDCRFLGAPLNGSSSGDLTVFPNTKRFTCDAGFVLGGSPERTCQAHGTWSGINTTCTAIDCGQPSTPKNGSAHGELTTYPNILRFKCDEGFTLLGSTRRKCQTNGTWSGVDPICQANDCGKLLIPQNGSLFGNKTTFPNFVTFSCDKGFILKGSKVRHCQANKTWTGKITYCKAVDCGALDPPRNGSLSGNWTVFPNSLHFQCDPGFNLSGSSVRTCQANGTWSGLKTLCSAIDCGILHPPQNGSVFGERTTYPNMLQFSCDEGFTLHGSSDRKCQTNGTWSGTKAFCEANDCGPLPIPMNGTLSGNLTTFPNTVNFTCDEGFILQGSAVRQCQADKHWSGNDTSCNAFDCGPLDAPKNGSLSGNLTVFPNSVHFQCDKGFFLSGSSIRTCQANGTWSGLMTWCSAVDCGKLQTPRNGSMFGKNTTYPNMLRFTCDEGYTLFGSSNRKCQANGTWSGTNAFCQANDCGPLLVPMNGTLSGNLTTYPNEVIFTCDEGFILKGSAVRRCQPDKYWSGNDTFCEAKDCGPLAVLTNGSSAGSVTTFPNRIIFSCDEGFILRGSQVRRCQSNARWSGNETFCEAKDCGGLVTPTNGSLFGNLTTYPHEMVFACDEGFILQGSNKRQCLSSGNWSGNETTCEAEDCGSLPMPTNGSVSGEKTTYPNQMAFSCDDGFIQRGSVIRKCQANGTWSGYATFCEAKDCGPLHAPVNGSSTGNLSTFPNKVLFQCDEGFILKGSEIRQCQANGLWTGNETTCEAVDCGRLQSPLNGSLSGNLSVYPNSVRLWCDPGFVMHGPSFRTCQSNGIWDGFETFCKAIDCGELHVPRNGTMVGNETTYPNTVKFSCDEGFILVGSWIRECQTNGTWSGNETECQAQDCGPLALPANGSSIGKLTVFPNKIVFSCDEGFILRGSDIRHCKANGTWSGNQTFCEAVDCGPLSAPINGSSSGDSTVFPNSLQFNCDPGFILNGSTIRTCQPNGTWSGFPTVCSAVDCGQPQPLQNGSIIGEKTVYPHFVYHTCDEGFILRGSPNIKCQTNGTWSKTTSFCEAKDCGTLAVPMNGSITGRETTFPNEVNFSCDEGFLLNGSTVRRCQADGSWSGTEASCEAVDCGLLAVPMNGSSSGDSTVFPNSVLFHCDPGFILSGSSKRSCQPNGTWSGLSTICTAKDCGPLAVPNNGSSLGNLTIFPNKIHFGCDEGFNLRGSHTRHCQANGTWSGKQTFCQAVDCGPLSVPVNGSSSGDSSVFPNSLLFNCDPGFILSGSTIRTCQPNGIWSGFSTVCGAVDCGPLSVPMNGSSTGNITVFPNSVQFNCDPGFILNGSIIRMCQANGTWSGFQTLCNAVDCGQPQPLQNGSIIGEETVYPNFMTYICDDGFILRGSPRIQCQTNGTWSKTSSFCQAKDCGALAVPLNGSINGRETTFPNEATFSCDEGFILNGSTVRRCQANGTWSGVETSCHAVDCGPLSVPMNGSSLGDTTVFPNSVLFKCDAGFNLHGSSSRTCQSNGTWSGSATACVAKDCGPLAVPTNGSSIGNLTVFPNKILFGCDEGFLLKGSYVRHCQDNGNWSGNQTFCEAIDCGPLSVPTNGSSVGDSTVFPNSVQFNCDPGFILSGSYKRTCQANGTWSGSLTQCSAVDCGPLSVPMNGSSSGDSTVFPNHVQFDCDPGFILNGSKTRTCQANGTWSGFQALCSAVDCGRPQPLQNGSTTGENTVYPNFVNHVCDEGFILRGSPKIECQANGTWSKTLSFCQAKDCGTLRVPLNGSLTGRETTFPNEVTFSCDEGFILNGSSVRRCQSNGSWSGIQTSCEAVDCGPLSVPTNGSSAGDATVFPNSVLFECDPGFTLNGSSKRSCQPNRTWSGLTTVCVAKDCGALAVPTNGSSTGDLTIFPNKIDFSCDEGFNLLGSRTRHCQADGTWSGNQTYCEAVDCGSLSAPINGSSSGDLTVFPNSKLFSCDPGFILNGSTIRTCQANGTWSGLTPICVAVDCGPISVPTNGSSSGDSTVFPNNVVFMCDPGFILNGSTLRTCQSNGTWSGFPTVCSAVDCGRPKPLQNGSIIGEHTVYPNYVSHICDNGFILRGSPKIQCQTNGTWSKTSSYCEAKDCGPLTVPVNGSITGRETTFPNEVRLSCDEGFILHGSTARRCQADGSWSGNETSCKAVDCGPLTVPRNGSFFGELTVFPNSVQFFCHLGFILSGSNTRQCQANGTWSGMETICTPVDCGPLHAFQNGSFSGESTVFPNVVKAACDMGFILRGSSQIKCQANGTWSSTDIFCEAKDCGHLPSPLNGSVIGFETTYPNELEFKCDAGFQLQGSVTRKCETDGQWSGEEVTCEAVDCGPLVAPEHGVAHGNSTTYPNVITFSCNTGFSLQGTSTRMCQADGTWTSGEVLCQGGNCGPLLPPDNGWMFGSQTTHPHSVIFSCGPGYRLVGPSERTCLRNGSWSGQQPKCMSHWCNKAPDVPEFAYQTWKASKKRYESGETIYYSCRAGYIMVGIPVRQCNMGEWSKLRFSCSAPSCNAPKVPKFAYVTSARGAQSKYLNGEKVYYSCRVGYELVGIPQIECQDGVWTEHGFSCEAVNCGSLNSPSNGWIQRKTGDTFGKLYVFMCNVAEGYLMRGSKERRCLANATWSGVQPVCYLQTCDAPRKPEHGKFTSELSNKYFFGNVVLYQCNYGFSPRGHEETRCQIHGNWSNPAPTCISCSSPLGLKNRMIFSHQLSASSERDSRHRAKHGRLHGSSAWCSARSSFPKYFQIDFGRTMEVTAVATQGHPRERKWVLQYVLKYSLGKNWLTYQESGRDKVFKGNRDGNTVAKHYLKDRLVAKTLRILRHQNSKDFMGSTVCLRAEVYGCEFQTDCLTIGSEVFARWNSVNKHTRYFHGYITKVRKTSVEVAPSGKHGAKVSEIDELPRAKEYYVIRDRESKPADIKIGSEVIAASADNVGFSQGKLTQKFNTWYGVELGNGEKIWSKAHDIRLLTSPVYCDRE